MKKSGTVGTTQQRRPAFNITPIAAACTLLLISAGPAMRRKSPALRVKWWWSLASVAGLKVRSRPRRTPTRSSKRFRQRISASCPIPASPIRSPACQAWPPSASMAAHRHLDPRPGPGLCRLDHQWPRSGQLRRRPCCRIRPVPVRTGQPGAGLQDARRGAGRPGPVRHHRHPSGHAAGLRQPPDFGQRAREKNSYGKLNERQRRHGQPHQRCLHRPVPRPHGRPLDRLRPPRFPWPGQELRVVGTYRDYVPHVNGAPAPPACRPARCSRKASRPATCRASRCATA